MKCTDGLNVAHLRVSCWLHALLILIACIIIFPWRADAGTPLEELKSTVDKITAVLDDKAMRDTLSREALVEKLKAVAQDRFDWEEIAKRSLGLYWKDRSDAEKVEFTALLKNLLLNSYLTKIVDNYAGQSVIFDKEIIEEDNRAQVESRIVNKADKSIVIGARLMKKGDRWMVYDLIIEGVSSLKNYRAQFYDIIRHSSFSDLLQRLRDKQKVEPAIS
jgi:phospholipid transport system substrate-binding protein